MNLHAELYIQISTSSSEGHDSKLFQSSEAGKVCVFIDNVSQYESACALIKHRFLKLLKPGLHMIVRFNFTEKHL